MLALPASAAASTGLVVNVTPGKHSIQLAGPNHTVSAYHYHGKLPKKVHAGSWISYKQSSHSISHVRSQHGSHTVSFKATVVKTSKGSVVLRLSDGSLVKFSAGKLRRHRRHAVLAYATAGDVTLNIQGLSPGETVLVTEEVDANGNLTITITLPSQSGNGNGNGGVSGTDQDVDRDDHAALEHRPYDQHAERSNDVRDERSDAYKRVPGRRRGRCHI